MKKGYMYILRCANNAYYTGSTVDLERRLNQHQNGEGSNFTRKYRPVELVYYEEHERIEQAFYREKQVQGWTRAKKESLIKGETNLLHKLAECKNETHCRGVAFRLRSTPNNHSSLSGEK
jgi:putative endonuclease